METTRTQTIPPGPYGLLDTIDQLWIGSNDAGTGTRTYKDYWIARVAAQVIDIMLKQKPGRTRAVTFEPGPKKLRATVDADITPLDAIKELEGEPEEVEWLVLLDRSDLIR